MPNLYQALGLQELLDSADVCLPGWGLCHPDLGPLLSLEDVDRASRTGSPTARNEVLLQLAQLGREAAPATARRRRSCATFWPRA